MHDTITMKENLEELTKGILEISDKLAEMDRDNIILRSKIQKLNIIMQRLLDEKIKELQEFNKYAKEELKKESRSA
tara:strand:- start:55 stop:282 length:228 start_codon:yes stop_codon:yes gene_type:complete